LIGWQVAAGATVEFTGEETFGLVVSDIEIAAQPAEAVGESKRLPAARHNPLLPPLDFSWLNQPYSHFWLALPGRVL